MGRIISKHEGIVITVPVNIWNALKDQATRLYFRMMENREDANVLHHEDAYEKVGFASSTAGIMCDLFDAVDDGSVKGEK